MKLTNNLFAIALLGTGLAFAPSANAKGQGRDTKPKRAKKVSKAKAKAPAKKAKNFDFTGDEIDVSRIRPDGTAIFGLQGAGHKSLIRLRSEFIGQIIKSAEML
jgi:hypothetical protein